MPFLYVFSRKMKKNAEKFGGTKKSYYLCNRLRKVRALSSAGLEHLPYKQRVGGSNPSAPTIGVVPCGSLELQGMFKGV